MSASSTSSASLYSSSFTSEPPLIWTRPGSSGDNIVVMSRDEMAVGKLPGRQLTTACEELESGRPAYDVLGPKATYVQFGAVRCVSATLNRRDLVVEYDKGSRKFVTRKVPLPDSETQIEALDAAHGRMPGSQIQKSRANRLFHMMLPFNLMMAMLMAAGGFHHMATSMFAVPEARDDAPEEVRFQRAPRPKLVRGPALVKLAIVVAAGVTALLLSTLGYQMTLNVFFTAAGAAFFWTVLRVVRPPVTLSAVVAER